MFKIRKDHHNTQKNVKMIHKLEVTFYFFFQAEDGIRDAQESRGLGDVYKRQGLGKRGS